MVITGVFQYQMDPDKQQVFVHCSTGKAQGRLCPLWWISCPSVSIKLSILYSPLHALLVEVNLAEPSTDSRTLLCLAQPLLLYFGLRTITQLTLNWKFMISWWAWLLLYPNFSLRLFMPKSKYWQYTVSVAHKIYGQLPGNIPDLHFIFISSVSLPSFFMHVISDHYSRHHLNSVEVFW